MDGGTIVALVALVFTIVATALGWMWRDRRAFDTRLSALETDKAARDAVDRDRKERAEKAFRDAQRQALAQQQNLALQLEELSARVKDSSPDLRPGGGE